MSGTSSPSSRFSLQDLEAQEEFRGHTRDIALLGSGWLGGAVVLTYLLRGLAHRPLGANSPLGFVFLDGLIVVIGALLWAVAIRRYRVSRRWRSST